MLIWCRIINTLPTHCTILFTVMYICCPLYASLLVFLYCTVLHGVLCIMCIMHVALCVQNLCRASGGCFIVHIQ